MKTRRLFQVAAALFAFLFAVALLFLSAVSALPILTSKIQIKGDLLVKLAASAPTIASGLKFLPQENNVAIWMVIGIVYSLPALLLLIAGLVWFSKPKKSQAKYTFADVIAVIGLIIFVALFEYFAKAIFGETGITWRIAVGAAAFLLLFLMTISEISKPKKKAVEKAVPQEGEVAEGEQPAEETPAEGEQPAEDVADAEGEQVAPAEQPAVEQTEPTPAPASAEQPAEPQAPQVAPAVQPEEPTPAPQPEPKPISWEKPTTPAAEYIPTETHSVSDVVNHTYGATKVESISDSTLKKIQTLRTLLETGVITKDEYITLVDSYLKESK